MPVICGYDFESNIDIVFCVDISKDMAPIVGEFKEKAHTIYERFVTLYEEAGIGFSNLRVRIITFGGCILDGDSICESKFFKLNDEKDSEEFNRYVQKIEVACGSEEKRNSLDALRCAMKSNWTNGSMRRHAVVMLTDAPAKPLAEKMNESLDESVESVKKQWEEMEARAKRLFIFAPDVEPWTDIGFWEGNVIHLVTEAGKGCDDVDMDIMTRLMVNSL